MGQDANGFYQSGGSTADIQGAAALLDQLSADELFAMFMAEPQPNSARPAWMVTRFPVSMEEYERLNAEATEAGPPSFAAEVDDADIDADVTAEYEVEAPEDSDVADEQEAQAPPMTASFEGIPQTAWRPPDNTIAVGPNDVMLAVNTDLAIYDRNGNLRVRWANMTPLFRNVLPTDASLFDPKVAYDHYARRWIVVIAARRNSPAGSWIMVAVSQTANPQGAYWVWALNASVDGSNPSSNWADYPMLGFDTQGIYISTNQFLIGGGFQYAKLRILNKAELYAGGNGPNHFISWFDYWDLRNPDNSHAFTIQPAVHFRGTGGNPPAYLVNALWPGGDTLTLWKLTNPIGFWTGGAAALTRDDVDCRRYDLPPDAEQPDSTVRIANNDARLLSAIYQYAGGVQRLWTAHTSKHTWGGESVARSVVQWYEIDVAGQNVVQENAYGAPGRYYYFPAIQTDIRRNAYVVFGRSNASEYGSIRQSGRKVGDAADQLQNSALVKAGESAYTGGRWGDYFGICRDPANTQQVWAYAEYADSGGNWGTWVAAMRF